MTARRRGGRKRGPASDQPPRTESYRQLRHPFAPQTVFSDDEIAQMHETALRVLSELGVKVLLPEAREILASGGALIDEDMVRIGPEMVAAALETAPARVRFRAINPAREQMLEDGAMLFYPGSGCPNVSDAQRGRRAGDAESYVETIKLHQSFDVIHAFGPSAEPQDIPVHLRHYEMLRAQMVHGDKPMFVYARGRRQVAQSLEMIQTGFDLSDDEMTDGVWALTVINTNSPRQIDQPMAQGLIDFARAGQLSVITPFCLAGAMAPITVAGALVLQHAEALAAITLAQLAKPGAPVLYGGFSSNVDMKSGSPAFGTPEHIRCTIGSGQLARHIGLPWRSACGAASNTPDMQAAQETTMSLWAALQANATLTVHAAGWQEGGLTFGYEKFINDIEALQTVAELCRPEPASADDMGFDAIVEVDPGGHFFAAQHTMSRYADAFYQPLVADLSNYETWAGKGGQTSADRATAIWQQVLSGFRSPPTGAAAAARLAPYIETATRKGGAAPMDD